ncbi:hypothetical protein F8388_023622 [Cannabis sativa]|uniref:Uncharacterized protein n=1 Tax=Cannabis sativa TaxID=3483 RepID=A0A7J6G9H4_CANSA|nr:hypothetical protein F8388_023622 [Cannabis sativa]
MAFGLSGFVQGKKALRRSLSGIKEATLKCSTIPKGYFAVYVQMEMNAHKFGYEHPMGGLTIPCSEDIFIDITSQLN